MGVSVEKEVGVGFLRPWVQPSANLKAQTLTQPSPLAVEEEEEDGVAVMDQHHQISTLSASQGGINKHLQWYLLFYYYSINEIWKGS